MTPDFIPPAITITKQPNLVLRESVDEVTGKKDHSYWLTGEDGKKKRIPGVTTICGILDKPALKFWSAKMAAAYLQGERDVMNPDTWVNPPIWEAGKMYTAEEIAFHCDAAKKWHADKTRKAGDMGTAAHDWMENYVYGVEQPLPEHPKVKESVEKFLAWRMRHHVEWVEIELSVTDGKVGGKIDVLAWVDGVLRVVDLKTGKGLWSENIIQVGKYHDMVRPLVPAEIVMGTPVMLHASREGGDFAAYELPVTPERCAERFERLYLEYREGQEFDKARNAMVPMEAAS